METDPQHAPSVVSVMVVHEPGGWFDETLESLAAQDYPNLRTLFLVTPTDDDELADLTERIRAVLPAAFVRTLPTNDGFGCGANEVLRLVDGDNGFFLILHDDVALAPTAVRVMVAEMFRSNAGIIGPKLTEWDDVRMLQHVGLGLDRFGEVDPVVEPGEFDQEQHDAVRDVFVLPSACLLVRADLFRTVGGFDPSISFHGDDVDLCWRAHLTGARVIVVPDAQVRHRERLADRRPDLPHRTLRSRHRMRTVATLTGASRLLGRSVQLVLLTLVELVVGLFTGRFGEALASLRALVALIPRTGSIVARRRAIRGQRVVPEREVLGLQDRGSSRLTSYLRGKDTATYVGADATVRRWREASFGPVLAWFLVVLAIVVGSREFITGGVPQVGEFLTFPASPGDLLDQYRSSFDARSFGSTTPAPTGWAVLTVVAVLAAFRMSLLLTMSIVGLYLLGAIGAWRLATIFPSNRARIAGMVVYVATPLIPGLLGRGDWSGLVWFAALPWLVHLLRRTAGLETADPDAAADGLVDGVAAVGLRDRLRAVAFLTLVLALAAAFVPVAVALWTVVGAALAVATLLAGSSWRVAAWFAGGTVASVVGAFMLNLPWSLEWRWDDLVDPPLPGATGRSIAEVASLAPTTDRFAVLAVALYLPVVVALVIARAWRLTWAVRAAVLVIVFGAAMLVVERGLFDVAMPSPALLAAPVALGLALSAASLAGGFGDDVLGRGFGWRQPVAILANVAVVVGLVPAAVAVGDGAWHTPGTTMPQLLAAQLPVDPSVGDYRVLYVGDPRVLPVPAKTYVDGIGYAVVDAGPLDFTDRFPVVSTGGDAAVERALSLIAQGSTLRAGRLLAPLGIRYVVIPEADGVVSKVDDPVPLPAGLVASMQNQLDLGSVYGPPSLTIFVNRSFVPVGAQLAGATAEASRLAGEDVLVRADLTGAVPSMIGADGHPAARNQVAPGAVHVAIPYDPRLTLEVDGRQLASRPSFGIMTAFDVDRDGVGALGYRRDSGRSLWLAVQSVLWLVVLAAAAGARSPFGRRRVADVHDETLIDLSDELPVAGVSAGVAGEALGMPTWGEPATDPDPLGDADTFVDPGQPDVVERRADRAGTTDSPGDSGRGEDADHVGSSTDAGAPDDPDDADDVDLAALVARVDERSEPEDRR